MGKVVDALAQNVTATANNVAKKCFKSFVMG
jgi:hypothetical protein